MLLELPESGLYPPSKTFLSMLCLKVFLYPMCNYKFDLEHGIAVVFENGKK